MKSKLIEMDDATLHAFVDNQLDATQKSAVLEAMNKDASIRERVCQLRNCKDWITTGFGDAEPPGENTLTKQFDWYQLRTDIAACFLVIAVGLLGGIAGYFYADPEPVATGPDFDPNRLVLHIDENNADKFKTVLDYAERFLEKRQDSAVEVLVNADGLDLVRSGISPYESRVRALAKQHDNLHFIACVNSIRRLKAKGITPNLIPQTDDHESAVEHVARRIKQGWTYRKVDQLPEI